MTWIYTIIAALVEGLTEFLPISSTGHLIILNKFMNVSHTSAVSSFDIFIQLGAVLAVSQLYFKDIITNRSQVINVIYAFIPTAIVGLVLYPLIKDNFLNNLPLTVVSLIIGGVVILFLPTNPKIKPSPKPYHYALLGLIQSLSIIPGTSRALTSIIGGLVIGLSYSQAVHFSFLLAIPTILAATFYDLLKTYPEIILSQAIPQFVIGATIAFITAHFSVKFFLNFVKNQGLRPFGFYRIILGLILLTSLI